MGKHPGSDCQAEALDRPFIEHCQMRDGEVWKIHAADDTHPPGGRAAMV
jgi:hypothetical protein